MSVGDTLSRPRSRSREGKVCHLRSGGPLRVLGKQSRAQLSQEGSPEEEEEEDWDQGWPPIPSQNPSLPEIPVLGAFTSPGQGWGSSGEASSLSFGDGVSGRRPNSPPRGLLRFSLSFCACEMG